MNKSILIALVSLLLGACATAAPQPTAENATSAIADAQQAQRRAAEVGHEWRDTQEVIADAQKAAEAREYAKAIELAGRAERQSLAALRQFKTQKNVASIY